MEKAERKTYVNGNENDKDFNNKCADKIEKYWFSRGYDPEVKVIKRPGFADHCHTNVTESQAVLAAYVIRSNLVGTFGYPRKKVAGSSSQPRQS